MIEIYKKNGWKKRYLELRGVLIIFLELEFLKENCVVNLCLKCLVFIECNRIYVNVNEEFNRNYFYWIVEYNI